MAIANEWNVERITDPVTSEQLTSAVTENSEGFKFSIFRNADKKVRWLMQVPQGQMNLLKTSGHLGDMQVDSKETMEIKIDLESSLEQPTVVATSLRELLWHGEGASPTRGTLRDIMDGKTLVCLLYTSPSPRD